MYITKVISYNGAWEKLLSEHEATFHELQELLEKFVITFHDPADWLQSGNFIDQVIKAPLILEDILLHNGWVDSVKITSHFSARNSLGLMKNGISIEIEITSDMLTRFIYKKLRYLEEVLKSEIDIPILVNISEKFLKQKLPHSKKLYDGLVSIFEDTLIEFEELQPLPLNTPFLIFGIDSNPDDIEVINFEGKKEPMIIERSITFEPAYFQAGLGLMSYFGTVLSKKYPDQNAKVKIEQDGLNIRLIVELENGNKEIIEHALHEYGLVLSGERTPYNFFNFESDNIELRSKLRTAEMEIRNSSELIISKNQEIARLNFDQVLKDQIIKTKDQIIATQEADFSHLSDLFKTSLVNQQPISIQAQITNTNTLNHTINIKNEVNQTYKQLDRLIDVSDSADMKSRLRDLQNALDSIKDKKEAAELEDSSAMKKLAKLLKETDEAGSSAKGLIEKGGEAFGIFKKLGEHYNVLAKLGGFSTLVLSYLN